MTIKRTRVRFDSASRRGFLRGMVGVSGLAAVSAGPTAAILNAFAARPVRADVSPDYGPLSPIEDETTGLPLLQLPQGFRYISYGWTGDPMKDGRPTPAAHDGMAVVKTNGNNLVLVRNHEVRSVAPSFGKKEITYDPMGGGGTTNLGFNAEKGEFTKSWASLAGTSTNCAGGSTPWDSWMTCEETRANAAVGGYQKEHGWVFDVPAEGQANPEPIRGMGRFDHEAIAVDPMTGAIYQTEDSGSAGFYRYTPTNYGKPHAGGTLEMLKIVGQNQTDLTGQTIEITKDTSFDVEWVTIGSPESVSPSVFNQGFTQGGARFIRLEGCWHEDGGIYFTSTSGGLAQEGQIWRYDITLQTLTLIFSSPNEETLDNPDNITVHAKRGIVLCEDGDRDGQRMLFLTPDGQIYPFAANDIVLDNFKGNTGDFRGREWAGACFSPDGQWLFANIQTPGVTFAITGPWKDYDLTV
jgi:secreted PhoX family phosphatase